MIPRYLYSLTISTVWPSYVKEKPWRIFPDLLYIITLVLATFTFRFHLWKNCKKLFNIFCKPLSDNNTISSAYIRQEIKRSQIWTWSQLSSKLCFRSLINKEKKVGLSIQSRFTPDLVEKLWLKTFPILTEHRTDWYISLIILKKGPVIFYCSSLNNNAALFTTSNALLRGRSLFTSWGRRWGGGWVGNLRRRSWKKSIPQCVGVNIPFMNPWEVGVGVRGGITNIISISFTGIIMPWLLGGYLWCPLSTSHRRKENYAYADVQTQSNCFAAINAHRRN